jgi:tetratricopeptide (TPR) repeat protein
VKRSKAADYARRAGERALQSLAPAEALRLFGDAVELSGELDDVDRCEALIGLGEAQRQTGNAAYRDTLLEASRIASTLGDAGLVARAALANNRGYSSVIGEVDRERLTAIERAIELDAPPQPARRARLLALQAQELSWDPDFDHRRQLAEEAIALARSADDARTLVEVLCQVSYALWSAETLELRSAIAGELASAVPSVGDPALQFSAQYIELSTCIERGELLEARAVLDRMQASSDELGQPTFKWFAAFPRASYELMCGDLAAAERLGEHAFQLGQEAGESDAVLIYGAQLGYIRTCQGRGEEMIGMLEQSVSFYPGIAAWQAALAWAQCWLGRKDEARALVEQAMSDGFANVQAGPARLTALALYADAAYRTGANDAAASLYEQIEPSRDQVVWNSVTGCGHARMWLGLLASLLERHELADEHLAIACERQEAEGLTLWAARARLGWAEALARRGNASDAGVHAQRALELSREHGYGLFEPEAAAILAAASRA